VSGVDPQLILVVELNREVPSETWRDAGLLELDGSVSGTIVAFSSDPQMAAFMERLSRHRAAKETKGGYLFAADLFDAIEEIRRYGRQDRVAPRLAAVLDSAPVDPIAIDIELWHPGDDVALAESWREMVESRVTQLQGEILDRYIDHPRGLVLLRARLGPAGVSALAEIDEVATLDTVPQAPPVLTSALDASIEDLPPVEPPGENSPLLTVIDSGINASHPLLSGAVY
jgi:hypothetical protein